MTVAQIIEDLRDEAVELEPDLDGLSAHELFGAQAAQVLEEFESALTQIAGGAPDPQEIARAALALAEPLKPIGDDTPAEPEDIIRAMLKPRSV